MHDLDRTLGRTPMETEMFEYSDDEMESGGDDTEAFIFEAEQDETFDEAEVNELAAELLSVSNQQEFDYFLGGLIKKAGKAIGKAVRSPLGKQLGGMLKTAAKKALPIAGGIAGNAILPGVGGAVGGKLGSMASSMFGLELEGLSPEDRQFEAAKQFVRFSGDAATKAVKLADQGVPPPAAATKAVKQAAQNFLPGLERAMRNGSGGSQMPQRGSWERKGNTIVINLPRA